MRFVEYCPKCGDIGVVSEHKCVRCNHKTITTKYSLEEYFKDRAGVRKIIEEYVKNLPDFDEELSHKTEKGKNNYIHSSMTNEEKTVLQNMGVIPKPDVNTIECPYCHSTNVSKISTLGRAASVGIFGLASKKIGKQWHCNHCKSNF